MRRQAFLRETLGPFRASPASRSQTLALPGLLQVSTCAIHPIKLLHAQGDIKASWVTSWSSKGNAPFEKGQPPWPRLSQSVLDGTSFFFSGAKAQSSTIMSLPLMGSQQPSDGLFSPMEVRTNHLPMCTGPRGTCPSGMILHIKTTPSTGSLVIGIIAMSITFHH